MEMSLCCVQECTTVTKGGKKGEKADDMTGGQTPVRNRFEALAREEDGPPPLEGSDDKSDGRKEKTPEVVRRWSRNASHKKSNCETCKGHRAVETCSEVCWLCEEYDEERLPHTGVGCCFKAKEPEHDEHICSNCHAEINQRSLTHPEPPAAEDLSGTATGPGGESARMGLFQEMHQDNLNGCDDKSG